MSEYKLPLEAKDVIDLVRSIEKEVTSKIVETFHVRDNNINFDAIVTESEINNGKRVDYIVKINDTDIKGSFIIPNKDYVVIQNVGGHRFISKLLERVEIEIVDYIIKGVKDIVKRAVDKP